MKGISTKFLKNLFWGVLLVEIIQIVFSIQIYLIIKSGYEVVLFVQLFFIIILNSFAIFGINGLKINQSIEKKLSKKGLLKKEEVSTDKNIKKAAYYSRGKIYMASLYLSTFFSIAGAYSLYDLLGDFLYLILIIALIISFIFFVVLFYYFEFWETKTVEPSITFWEYFNSRLFINLLRS